ncbi:AAA family ATPase [Ferrimicrobium sp.]|uniref:HelD family protein n=1 Tax=Ferrimicrobium sp. TaxID=2926050 RepID=UPI0026111EF9|nr:AAA family ATPase [Ferrimicrobium sp.]
MASNQREHATGAEPDAFEAERAYVERAYKTLDDLKARIEGSMHQALELPRGGTPQARLERDVTIETSLTRLARLEVGAHPLLFGRIDFGDTVGEASYHIGRISLSDAQGDPLVVDWRAPVAEAFYRATALHPMGLQRRWHLAITHRTLVGLECEDLAAPDRVGQEDALVGRASLYAALERPRTLEMANIVETIQADQDELIRRPLNRTIVIEGSPGTGKTAVALHRAAYLVYTYRWRLERQGVLVLGPSESFVRYVRSVLPSLGESGVEVRSIAGLREPHVSSTPTQDPAVARLKGDPRMARVLFKAVKDRERPLKQKASIPFGSRILVVSPELTQQAILAGAAAKGRHNQRRKVVESYLARELASEFLRGGQLSTSPADLNENVINLFDDDLDLPLRLPEDSEEDIIRDVVHQLRRVEHFQRIVERIWPVLQAEELLFDLFTHRPLLQLAARSILRADEVDSLVFPPNLTFPAVQWTDEDVILLDEIDMLVGVAQPKIFGHVIVDEAQDISPMAARVIRRRTSKDSLTVLGDLAQAVSPYRGRSWKEVMAPFGVSGFELIQLPMNYRSPRLLAEVSGRLRRLILGNQALEELPVRGVIGSLETTVIDRSLVVGYLEDRVRSWLADSGGTAAIVVPDDVPELLHLICNCKVDVGRVFVASVSGVKGMEFDSVALVGFDMPREGDLLRRSMYVALTRATRSVSMVFLNSNPGWVESILAG